MIQWLLPHVQHSLRVRYTLGGAETLSTSLSRLLDSAWLAVIQLGRQGRIVATSGPARDLLRRGLAVFEDGGFLRARVAAESMRLEELVAAALP